MVTGDCWVEVKHHDDCPLKPQAIREGNPAHSQGPFLMESMKHPSLTLRSRKSGARNTPQ